MRSVMPELVQPTHRQKREFGEQLSASHFPANGGSGSALRLGMRGTAAEAYLFFSHSGACRLASLAACLVG
jgi:hypothetical protein